MILEDVRQKMYSAMKKRNKPLKDVYALIFDQLKKNEIDLRRPLTEQEELETVSKMLKQAKEALAMMPADTDTDFTRKLKFEIPIYEEFLPKQLSEEEIKAIIKETMVENGIEEIANSTRGILMKNLMPKVKGLADGKLVSQIVSNM